MCHSRSIPLLAQRGWEYSKMRWKTWRAGSTRMDERMWCWHTGYQNTYCFHGKKTMESLGALSVFNGAQSGAKPRHDRIERVHGGEISWEMMSLQEYHCICMTSPCPMNGKDWMKHFIFISISHMLHLSHLQWTVQNFTLYNNVQGCYLWLKETPRPTCRQKVSF